MKRVAFGLIIAASLVVGCNLGFVGQYVKPAIGSTPIPCQFLGINDSGTTINTTIICVTPIASGGGVVTVKATATTCGQPVQPSPTAGAVVVEVPVCATSAPQNTASPTATSTSTAGAPSLVVSGSFPYTLAANFPVASGATTPTYDATVLANPHATHYWEMNDLPAGCASLCTPGPCPSTMADSISGGATAAPSPQVLTVVASPLPTALPGSPAPILCGAPGMIQDGKSSTAWLFETAATPVSVWMTVPAPVFNTLCGNTNTTCTSPWSVECVVSSGNSGGYSAGSSHVNFLWAADTSATAEGSVDQTSSGYGPQWVIGGGGASKVLSVNQANVQIIGFVYDGSANEYFYEDGVMVGSNHATTAVTTAHGGVIGGNLTDDTQQWSGRIQKCSTYNDAETPVQFLLRYLSSGLP